MRIILILLILYSCGKKNRYDFYDPANYKKINITDTADVGYEVYVCLYDTSRIMLRYYWDNGVVQAVNFFHNRKKDGHWRQYSKTGKLAVETNYLDGMRHDTMKIYNDKGILSSIEVYDKGRKVSVTKYDTLGNVISRY